MPIVILRACNWVQAILSQSGSLKVLSMPANSPTKVQNVDMWDNTALVLFSAQTCAIPPCMKERASFDFILLSSNMSSYIMMVIQMDWTNCLALTLLLLKLSGLAALAFLNEQLLVMDSRLVRIT